MLKLYSDIAAAKQLAKGWRSLARCGLTIEDIEQEILLAQLEFDVGLRAKDPRENPGLIYCQISSANAQISVGGSGEQADDGSDSYSVIAGVGIEHINPAELLEISQIEDDWMDDAEELEIINVSAINLASMLGLSTRHIRNIKNVLTAAVDEEESCSMYG